MAGQKGVLPTAQRLIGEFGVVGTGRLIARKWIRKLRHERPPNSPEANREVWTTHDWTARGDEWTPSANWKAAVIRELLESFIKQDTRVLEIGPGGGRWTEYLVPRASQLTLVDVTPVCIEMCRERFKDASNIRFHVNDGRDLSFVPPDSVDAIWSFDAFVHIAAVDVEHYVSQFASILAPGGVGIVHHSRAGVYRPSWRSDMTVEKMEAMCCRHRLEVVAQMDRLDCGRIDVYAPGGDERPDVVTVFRKPYCTGC